MKLFKIVNGVAQVGQGEVISIDDKQLKRRMPFVDVVKRAQRDGDRHHVRTKKVLDFKVGEVVGLTSAPPKSGRFEEVRPAQVAGKAAA